MPEDPQTDTDPTCFLNKLYKIVWKNKIREFPSTKFALIWLSSKSSFQLIDPASGLSRLPHSQDFAGRFYRRIDEVEIPENLSEMFEAMLHANDLCSTFRSASLADRMSDLQWELSLALDLLQRGQVQNKFTPRFRPNYFFALFVGIIFDTIIILFPGSGNICRKAPHAASSV